MFACPVRTAQIILFPPRRPIVLTVLFGPSVPSLTGMYVIPSNMRSAGSSLDGDGDGDDGSVEQHWEEPEGWYSLVVQRLHQYLVLHHCQGRRNEHTVVPRYKSHLSGMSSAVSLLSGIHE